MLKMAKMTPDNHKKKIKLKSNPRFLLKITTKSFETITKSNKMTTKRHKTYKLFQNQLVLVTERCKTTTGDAKWPQRDLKVNTKIP